MRRKNVTMKDIAEQLGLSINAVSLALNNRSGISEETRKQILNVAEELGYLEQTPRFTKVYASKNICVLLEHRFFRDFRFYGRVLLGIEEEAKKSGYDIFINSYVEEAVPPSVEEGKAAGVVVVGKIAATFLDKLKQYNLPIILVDYVSLEVLTDSVVTNNEFGTYKMTRYLIDKGYNKIGYFGDIEYSPSTRERFVGYLEAMKKYFCLGSLEECIDYIKEFSVISDVEDCVIARDGERLFEKFKNIKKIPEVLVCSNDELAIFLMQELQKRGYKIPEDIGVVGFDDIELCNMIVPSLTTVHVQKNYMGKKAVQRLLYRINNPKEHIEKLVLDVEIVERQSTKG